MISKVYTAAVMGIDAYLVEVETHLERGMPYFGIVGLPDNAVKESRERVAAAIKNSGIYFVAQQRITINLAPADIKKEGSSYDLPIAIGILTAQGKINSEAVEDYLILGELALDGTIRPVHGSLSIAIKAREAKFKGIILPQDNAREAAMGSGPVKVYPMGHLLDVVNFLNDNADFDPVEVDIHQIFTEESKSPLDLKDVKGQEHVKRAMEVAAAGGHNIVMIGPPGSGKTMLARRFPTILPLMSLEEAIETTKIHSVAGLLPPDHGLIGVRPFRAPHHTISDVALVGGGRFPVPVKLAWRTMVCCF